MTGFDWFLVGLWTVGILTTVLTVNRPRDPISPVVASVIVLLDLALIAGLLITRY